MTIIEQIVVCLISSVVVLEECLCPRGSSRTDFHVLVHGRLF